MAFPKHCLRVVEDHVYVFVHGCGRAKHHTHLIQLMEQTRSLAAVRDRFPGSRKNLLNVLKHFGFDFDRLLAEQFAEGHPDTKLAELHRVDAKWIAEKRRSLGEASKTGRPAIVRPDEDVIGAYDRAGSFAAAARAMHLDLRTFRKLYLAARYRKGLGPAEGTETGG